MLFSAYDGFPLRPLPSSPFLLSQYYQFSSIHVLFFFRSAISCHITAEEEENAKEKEEEEEESIVGKKRRTEKEWKNCRSTVIRGWPMCRNVKNAAKRLNKQEVLRIGIVIGKIAFFDNLHYALIKREMPGSL